MPYAGSVLGFKLNSHLGYGSCLVVDVGIPWNKIPKSDRHETCKTEIGSIKYCPSLRLSVVLNLILIFYMMLTSQTENRAAPKRM